MSEEKISIDEFAIELIEDVIDFKNWYLQMAEKKPDRYPYLIPDESSIFEQFCHFVFYKENHQNELD